jgi:hypothetical protein
MLSLYLTAKRSSIIEIIESIRHKKAIASLITLHEKLSSSLDIFDVEIKLPFNTRFEITIYSFIKFIDDFEKDIYYLI